MTVSETKSEQVKNILKEHQAFFYSNQTKDVNFRLEQLQKLKDGVRTYETKITEALRQDLGKHAFESYTTEIGYVLNSITHTMKYLKKWASPKKVKTPFALFPAKSMIRYEPYGTVLIIGPFNYPFQLLIEPLIGAIAAGNCVVLKPSELVPTVSQVTAEMIATTFDPSFIRAIQGGVETNTALIHAAFDYIFFTGSVPVGKIVMEAAAKNLVPVTLELGGKSPAIVDQSANLSVAAERIIWGKLVNAGQTCVAPDYLLVHEQIKKRMIEQLIRTIEHFYGSNVEESQDYGRIVNNKHFNRLKELLDREVEQVIYGGETNAETRFIGPTLLEATWTSPSMEEEIFGPLLPILTYQNLDDVIQEVNKHPKPLALYIFTADKAVEEKVLMNIPSGGVSINHTMTHLANPELPFGGIGSSGIGSYHGQYSFKTFSHQRSVLKSSTKLHMPFLFPPYKNKMLNMVRRILK